MRPKKVIIVEPGQPAKFPLNAGRLPSKVSSPPQEMPAGTLGVVGHRLPFRPGASGQAVISKSTLLASKL